MGSKLKPRCHATERQLSGCQYIGGYDLDQAQCGPRYSAILTTTFPFARPVSR